MVDALGFSERIAAAGHDGLKDLAELVESQFHQFRAKIPFRAMLVGRKSVFATREYATLRLNDMFVLHGNRELPDMQIRFLLCGSLLFHQMLLSGQIPRGGLGFGPIYRRKDLLIGSGFLDAYHMAEKRGDHHRDICAVLVSPTFLRTMPNTKRAWQLLCFYEGRFYVHPFFLTDPEMRAFKPDRILELLGEAGANDAEAQGDDPFPRKTRKLRGGEATELANSSVEGSAWRSLVALGR